MRAGHLERNERALILAVQMIFKRIDGAQALGRIGEQLVFMGADRIPADGVDVIDGRAKADRLDDGGCTRLDRYGGSP